MRRTHGKQRPLAIKVSTKLCFLEGSDGKISVIEIYSKLELEYSASSMLANEVGINTDVDFEGRNFDDLTGHIPG